jgi:hypothetical protein
MFFLAARQHQPQAGWHAAGRGLPAKFLEINGLD